MVLSTTPFVPLSPTVAVTGTVFLMYPSVRVKAKLEAVRFYATAGVMPVYVQQVGLLVSF